MNTTLNHIQPTLHELKLGLKELYGDLFAPIEAPKQIDRVNKALEQRAIK
ncbi:hypothetical protein H6F44_04180 [Pseudanabaena sp. FACHB-1277]|uniref:Uncharacterized protein n=1 Tax=Pseudanabaena cinerea FACHB-1277 TaxID=2949581 RepID=A0A926UQN7_9CYAN|nr:hypothetical protein [Pseudanabaena cinerea]MBD2149324.1 hypothetical protein [Pseudanabaena cinerea FACHB-1277]